MKTAARLLLITRYLQRHSRLLVLTILIGLGLTYLFSPIPVSHTIPAAPNQKAGISFGDTRTVGQSFIAVPGLKSLTIPLEILVEDSGPILLHIREGLDGEDLRVIPMFAPQSGEAKFSFEPLHGNRKLTWILEAPHNADKTVVVYREIDDNAYIQGDAYVKAVVISGNYAFSMNGSQARILNFISTRPWTHVDPEQVWLNLAGGRYFVQGFFVALALMAVYRLVRRPAVRVRRVVYISALLALLFHFWSANIFPLNNDEGAYLQDAVQTNVHNVPIADFLTKGPVYIYLLKMWQIIVPDSILWLRTLSAIAWSAVILLFDVFLRRNRVTPLLRGITAALLALSPAAVVLTTPLLLQVVSTMFVVGGLAALATGSSKKNQYYIALAGALMVIAYLTRASSAVGIFMGLLYLLLFNRSWRNVATYVISGLVITAGIVFASLGTIGQTKTAILFNIEALTIAGERQAVASEHTEEPILRSIAENARVLWKSSPWLILGVLLIPLFTVHYRNAWTRRIVLIIWSAGVFMFFWHAHDMAYLLPTGSPLIIIATSLATVVVYIVALVLRILGDQENNDYETRWIAFWGIWVGLLILLYGSWGNFVQNYLVEFLPPLTIMAAMSLTGFVRVVRNATRTPGRMLAYFSLLWLVSLSYLLSWNLALKYPHAGDIEHDEIAQVSQAIQRFVPENEPIFTAQSAFTALADREIMFSYSHSGWYLYEAEGEVSTELRKVYFQDPENITEFLDSQVNFVLTDRRTNEVYFNGYSQRQEILASRFEPVFTLNAAQTDDDYILHRRR
ncbi:MAG: hypothetical protein WD200_03870 [Candidatus Andersenbacteria bacterium]